MNQLARLTPAEPPAPGRRRRGAKPGALGAKLADTLVR